MTKTPRAMTLWTATTSVFDITTNLWLDAFLVGGGLISITMTTATLATKTMTTSTVTMMMWLEPSL